MTALADRPTAARCEGVAVLQKHDNPSLAGAMRETTGAASGATGRARPSTDRHGNASTMAACSEYGQLEQRILPAFDGVQS